MGCSLLKCHGFAAFLHFLDATQGLSLSLARRKVRDAKGSCPQLLLVVVGRLQRIWEAEEVKVEQTLEVSDAAQADRNQSVCDQNGSVQARVDLVRPRKEYIEAY